MMSNNVGNELIAQQNRRNRTRQQRSRQGRDLTPEIPFKSALNH